MENLKILVVGGSSFLGRNLVEKLQELGYECLTTTSKSSSSGMYLDLTNLESIVEFSERAPVIDGVIFMAGKKPEKNLEEISWDHVNKMFMIHFGGVLWCIKHLVPKIKSGGFLLLTSSVATKKGSYDPTYCSFKSAVEGLTRTLCKELAPNIRVNCVSPGLVKDSPVYEEMSENFRQRHLETTPSGNFCTVDDVTKAFLFAIETPSLNGQILQINGGQAFG